MRMGRWKTTETRAQDIPSRRITKDSGLFEAYKDIEK